MANKYYAGVGRKSMIIKDSAEGRLKHPLRAAFTARGSKGRCGRCSGLIAHDVVMETDVCRSCGRTAAPQW